MNTHAPLMFLFASAVAVGLTACGDAGESAEPGATAAVEITDSQYQPADLEVSAGTSVTWTNNDDVPHTVTFDDDSLGGSDQLAAGDTFTATLDDPGTYPYVCALHPEMTASVTVTE